MPFRMIESCKDQLEIAKASPTRAETALTPEMFGESSLISESVSQRQANTEGDVDTPWGQVSGGLEFPEDTC
jgi:hypothetical protein